MRRKSIDHTIVGVIGLLLICLPFVFIESVYDKNQSGKFIVFIGTILFLLLVCCIKIFYINHLKLTLSSLDIALGLIFLLLTINKFILQTPLPFSWIYLDLLGLFVLYVILRTYNASIYSYMSLCIMLIIWCYLTISTSYAQKDIYIQ